MSLQSIAQSLRGTRDKTFNEIADALREISSAFSNTYRDMGWFAINEKSSGIKKELLVTPQLNITAANQTTVSGRIYAENGKVILQLVDSNGFTVRSLVIPMDVVTTPGSIAIVSRDPSVLSVAEILGFMYDNGDYISSMRAIGGVAAGSTSTWLVDMTKLYGQNILTFIDPVDGDSIIDCKVTAAGGAEVRFAKGPDNSVSFDVDAAAVVVTIADITHNTTIKPASVATPRLAVGTTAPATDGHAVVATFLGTGGATAPAAGESLRVGGNGRVNGNLGIGMDPARALDVTGDVKATGTLEIDGAAQFDSTVTIPPLASGDVLVGQTGGTLSTVSPGTARFLLDVYTKAEVDAAIAAAIAAIVVDDALVGTPEEHSHTLS